MREIYCRSTGPRLVFSATGVLKLIRTGSDHFFEHNGGPRLLALKLCEHDPDPTETPSLMDRCRIRKPTLVEFCRLPAESAENEEAIIGVNLNGGHHFIPSELPPLTDPSVLRCLQVFHDGVAAALAYGNFAIRVRGATKVAALEQFHQQMIAGNVAILPDKWDYSGIAFVNLSELSSDERALVDKSPEKALVDWFRTPE